METTTTDLDALLPRVRAGDADAAAAMVERLYPAVMAVVQRRLPQTLSAEDMAQEVFLKLFASLPTFRGRGASLEAWARRVAFTTCLNQIRRESRRPELRWSDLSEEQTRLLESLSRTEPHETPGSGSAARELVALVLSRLPAPDRWLLELVELEERPLAEVAELTGWSHLNVRVRCFRARRRLRHGLLQLLREHDHA